MCLLGLINLLKLYLLMERTEDTSKQIRNRRSHTFSITCPILEYVTIFLDKQCLRKPPPWENEVFLSCQKTPRSSKHQPVPSPPPLRVLLVFFCYSIQSIGIGKMPAKLLYPNFPSNLCHTFSFTKVQFSTSFFRMMIDRLPPSSLNFWVPAHQKD